MFDYVCQNDIVFGKVHRNYVILIPPAPKLEAKSRKNKMLLTNEVNVHFYCGTFNLHCIYDLLFEM